MNRITNLTCKLLTLGLAVVLCISTPSLRAAEENVRYTLGVFPYLPLRELEQIFSPIAAAMSLELGQDVVFRSASSYDVFLDQLRQNAYDIAFVQPFDYVSVSNNGGYEPLAARDGPLDAVFAVSTPSSITTMDDLRGKRLALPPADAAVSQLALAYLSSRGIRAEHDFSVHYFKSHMSCLHQLLIAAADVCATARPPLSFFQKKMNVTLNVVGHSTSISGSLFVAKSSLPKSKKNALRHLLTELQNSPDGKKMIEAGEFGKFVPISDADYDNVRRLSETLK